MKNLIKYEFRNTRKNIFYIGLVGMIISLIIQWSFIGTVNESMVNLEVNKGGFGFSSSSLGGSLMIIKGILLMIAIFSIFGVLLAYFINLAHMMKKDLYTERGYLTFGLPVNGFEIIGAKLIVALVWSLVLVLLALAWNFILTMVFFKFGWSDISEFFTRFFSDTGLNKDFYQGAVKNILNLLIGGAFSIMMIYLSLITDKILRKKTSGGGFWIVIFFVYSFIYDSLLTLLYNGIYGYTNMSLMKLGSTNVGMAINLISVIILFIVNSYLIEKKVEI